MNRRVKHEISFYLQYHKQNRKFQGKKAVEKENVLTQ